MSYLDIKCCKCGSTYYAIRYSTSTAMYSPTIIKDGQVVSNNPNYTTYHCQCIACGAMFTATEHCGAIESVEIERGFGPVDIGVSAEENVAKWQAAAGEMNKEYVLTIKKEIAELQTNGAQTTYGNYKPGPNPCGE